MKRRDFLAGLGTTVLAAPRMIRAQAKTFRLGTVNPVSAMTETTPFGSFLISELASRGYVVGQNLAIDARSPSGDVGKIPALLQQLKARPVDALIIIGYPVALAAKSLGIPTVAAFGLGDPVATGLIQSLAHPGGNITGISDVAAELSTKRLSLLTQLSPQLKKVAMLWNKDDLGMTLRYEASAKAARELGVTVLAVGVAEPDDFNEAFTLMDGERPDAILMVADSLTNLNRL
jgi:putative ABC transport system substrate-binding protein